MKGQWHQMQQQATIAEVRLDAVGADRLSAAARSTGGFDDCCARQALSPIAQLVQKGDAGFKFAGDLANVGLLYFHTGFSYGWIRF
jgi:hypothetical protein